MHYKCIGDRIEWSVLRVIGAIDSGLEFYRQVLALRAYRQQILSADIANASTPQFKAIDLDFGEALQSAAADQPSSGALRASPRLLLVDDPRHQTPPAGDVPAAAAASIKYQTGNPVTLDGNSVDLSREKVEAAENALQYEAAAAFTSQTIRMLTIAINGSGSQQAGGS